MNDTITPRLRTDVLLKPFDAFEGDNRFLVAVDDRHFLVSPAVAAVLEASREHSTLSALAQHASARLGVAVSTDLASRVLCEQVLAICFHATEQRASSACPIRLRKCLLGARTLKPVLRMMACFFTRSAAIPLIVIFFVVETLVAGSAYASTPQPLQGAQIVCAAVLTAVGVVAHELGHLAACARFGATHGGIGIGVYWCMPVFYAEVNGAWVLPRQQRAAVDAGGLYSQCAYVVAMGIAYLATGAPYVLEAITWSHFLMLHTLNPVLKYDGYWLLTDLAGTPNLHAQIREHALWVWNAIRGHSQAQWPARRHLCLLGAFTALALTYFSYVIVVLGHNLGQSAGASLLAWAARDTTHLGRWHAAGEAALFALLLVIALSLASLLARAFTRIGKESQAC